MLRGPSRRGAWRSGARGRCEQKGQPPGEEGGAGGQLLGSWECGFQASGPNSSPIAPRSWSGTLNEHSSCRYLTCLLCSEKLECPKWRKSDVTYGWTEGMQ